MQGLRPQPIGLQEKQLKEIRGNIKNKTRAKSFSRCRAFR